MKISILTLFPQMFEGPLSESILKKASENNILEISYIDIKNFGIGKHKTVDDKPYGGGVGMLLRVDVVKKALDSARCKKECKERVILLDPRGEVFSQKKAQTFSSYDHLILICPHYEGVDERIKKYVDEEISIGDYILTGGEIPAMVVVDAIARLIPGVLGKDESSEDETFRVTEKGKLLEYPQYTRPEEFEDMKVPQVLISGNHKNIQAFKDEESLNLTKKKRPDLLHSSK